MWWIWGLKSRLEMLKGFGDHGKEFSIGCEKSTEVFLQESQLYSIWVAEVDLEQWYADFMILEILGEL